MIELTRGQTLPLADADGVPLTQLTMGVGWDKERTAGFLGSGAPDVDLDATAVQFMGDQLFDIAFYNNLKTRDGSLEHLGDNKTGSGEGDDEQLRLDLTRIYAKVDTIVLLVSSYQGHSLEWIGNAYCRLVEDSGAELARYTLTAGPRETGLVMATVTRAGDGWQLRAVGEGVPVRIPTDSVPELRRFL